MKTVVVLTYIICTLCLAEHYHSPLLLTVKTLDLNLIFVCVKDNTDLLS